MTWNAANTISNVFARDVEVVLDEVHADLDRPTATSVRPTGKNMRSGLYERIIRTTCMP